MGWTYRRKRATPNALEFDKRSLRFSCAYSSARHHFYDDGPFPEYSKTVHIVKILDFIQAEGKGSYLCYKTNKVSLDTGDAEVLDYDDKPVATGKKSLFAETDKHRVAKVCISDWLIGHARPIFSFFLDGSRHVYKVDDMAIGKKIYPVLAGQIVVGCCVRRGRDTFKPYGRIAPKVVMSLPDDFDIDDEGDNFCRLYCEKINAELAKSPFLQGAGIKMEKLLLYKTDGGKTDKDNYKNRGTAKIQAEMTDEEQRLVAQLCADNQLDSAHYLVKDGSLEYNPQFSNMDEAARTMLRENYRYVVGVSKRFNPELLPDFEGHRLSQTIASLAPFERTKAYRYTSDANGVEYAVWYLRLRRSDFRETHFSDVVKCEMVIVDEGGNLDTELIDTISANLIGEAYPVCYGNDSRWANHLYPVYLTETFCKSKYHNKDIILNLF